MGYRVLSVLALAAAGSAISEAVLYHFVYSTDKYKTLKDRVKRKEEELKQRQQVVGGNPTKRQQRIKVIEDQLNQARREAQALQFKSSLFAACVQMLMIYIISQIYTGIPVARLPFTPISFFQGITHRGLEGTDYTECSAVFLFIMTSLMTRSLLDKALNLSIPKGGSIVPEWASDPNKFLGDMSRSK
ncbi:hypothetical protein EV182_000783 [Spiromyces aspiralis]|uniref:Uncharacterized protein n=1 Tax=Spiromyces aspiralis TaxID=68401 RepID=A0ACC1HU21_9FUNG|nr:hypothetical protein EV182_000783 [Spiromyces aspiralis]